MQYIKKFFFRPFDFNVTYEHMLCENISVLDFPFLNIQIIKTNLVEFDQYLFSRVVLRNWQK